MENLEKLRKKMVYLAYYYQEDNYHNTNTISDYDYLSLVDSFLKECSNAAKEFDKTLWKMTLTQGFE
ncbi:hypothetical protein A4A49_09644 [Nicotiana attenuata]|uniref:Uncharacterized protein n=1 Tax=Nicotiana attenuata TaxID=49451 RepID=A0A1J6IH61_NICAT|nr:hypothetical protein A4A49_09644 [Nicotiana attenuata]